MTTPHPQQRGAHLLNAALAILADEGLAALSMRSVAATARVSLAQVQYYFRTKAELVDAAFEHASGEFLDTLHTVDDEPSVERLRSVIWLWLPLDDDRTKRARIWLAYAAAAATDRGRAAAAARLDADLREWFGQQLAALRHHGQVHADVDPDTAAAQLLALIDGLTVHLLMLPADARQGLAEQAVGGWLAGLIGSR